MNRIINIIQDKIQEIRGYMAATTKSCATGTCVGQGCGCHNKFALPTEKVFKEISEEFYEFGYSTK